MPKKPLSLRELLKKLRSHGIIVLNNKRGKGSEKILLQPDAPGSLKGRQYPIKDHGASTQIYIPVILAILRRFEIDKDKFWD